MPQELWRIDNFVSELAVLQFDSLSKVSKINGIEHCDVGYKASLVVTLLFIRLHFVCVNSRSMGYKEKIVYSWSTLIWFTSLDRNFGSTIIISKRNMVLETIEICFLTTHNDFTYPMILTFEYNEHTYSGWR